LLFGCCSVKVYLVDLIRNIKVVLGFDSRLPHHIYILYLQVVIISYSFSKHSVNYRQILYWVCRFFWGKFGTKSVQALANKEYWNGLPASSKRRFRAFKDGNILRFPLQVDGRRWFDNSLNYNLLDWIVVKYDIWKSTVVVNDVDTGKVC